MSFCRNIAVTVCCSVLISGCGGNVLPDIAPNFAAESRNLPWPEFLPIDDILVVDANSNDLGRIKSDNFAIAARVSNLRRRAILLRAPVVSSTDRLRMLAAIDLQPL